MFKNIYRTSNWIRNSTISGTVNNKATTTTNINSNLVLRPVSNGINSRLTFAQGICIQNSTRAESVLWQGNNYKNFAATIKSRFQRNMSDKAGAEAPKHTNRLAQEKSPYLLQHAHNPVDWYPWGEEAIERARRENKLIFLSVGYSTCHWCHVMEHESFENEAVAKIMNANFINVKVDREERPDIDKIYMQFVLMMNGSGGWPMSVWLTPDLAPITAGTYFPPHDRWGMPSFTSVLKAISSKWQSNQEELKKTGLHVITAIQKTLTEKSTDAVLEPGCVDAKLQEALHILKQRYDQQHGGFGSQPKFPEVARLNFLFHAFIVTKDADVLDMALQTLRHIGRGGIHDHVFGGFARYSVDRVWHVPHFEKMLYDQGQLMTAYANAYKLSGSSDFLHYADGIYHYITKDLRHPQGGFYSGEDADSLPEAGASAKVEGAFYAWTWDEVQKAVTENKAVYESVGVEPERVFDIYAYHYDLRPTGNVERGSDPHGELTGKNILIERGSQDATCGNFDIEKEQLRNILRITNELLHGIRDRRPRPHLDTKIICAWNGLVLSGLSKLANCGSLKRAEYLRTASELVDFVRDNLFDAERKVLLRSCYGVSTDSAELESVPAERIDGFLDDYAFLIKGLCDYYKASLDNSVLQWARQLQDTQDKLFWDDAHGAYFYSKADSPNVIVRLKEDHDGAEPCGNSVAARNLLLLGHYFDEPEYRKRARKLLEFFADVRPFACTLPEMMCAFMLDEFGLDLVAVVGPDTEKTKRFVEICRRFYIPGMIIVHVDPQTPTSEAYNQRVQQKFKMVNGQPTVYICHDKVCRMPVTDPDKLEANLNENFFRAEE